MHVLFSDKLTLVDHRLLWWLLARQRRTHHGVGTGTVPAGWRTRARKELHYAKVTIHKSQQRLKAAGLITCARFERNVRINGDAFKLSS